jgi:hypothetical protein
VLAAPVDLPLCLSHRPYFGDPSGSIRHRGVYSFSYRARSAALSG